MTFMRKRTAFFSTFVPALVLLSSPVVAQPRCKTTETLQQCWNHYIPDSAVNLQDSDAKLREVDSESAGDGAGAGTLTNTLNRLGFSGVFNGSDEVTGGDGRLAFDFSFLLPGNVRDRNGKLQVLVAMDSDLFEPLKMLLPEPEREQRTSELKKQIGDVDDYAASFTYNILSKKWGRSIEAHRGTYARIFSGIEEKQDSAFLSFLEQVQQLGVNDPNFQDLTIDSLAGGAFTAEQLRQQIEASAAAEASLDKDFVADAQRLFENFKYLVNNQPQFLLSAEHRVREPLVGADETTLSISWEQPLGPNVNRLLGFKPKDPAQECKTDEDVCLKSFSAFMKDKGKKVDNSDRAVFSLSYTHLDDYSIFRPNDGLSMDGEPFEIAGGKRLKVLAGWGRSFDSGPAKEDLAPSRLEIALSYEDLFDDPERQDRFLASLTYTVKLNNDVSIPLGLVYANKPEFLAMEDLDHQVSARVGIKFNLPGGKPKEQANNGN